MAPKGKTAKEDKAKAKVAKEDKTEEAEAKNEDVEMKAEETKEEVKEAVKEEGKEEEVKEEMEVDDGKSKEPEVPSKEPEVPKMVEETDAPADKRAKVAAADVGFNMEGSTCNAMPTAGDRLLMTLSDGGFQYLLAGVQCSAAVKSGRYMFETKIVESLNPSEGHQQRNTRTPQPRQLVRVGLAVAGSSPLLDESKDKVYFDNDGYFVNGRNRSRAAQRFGKDHVVALLVNMDAASPNANTVSLFIDGRRISDPQKLPESFEGKAVVPCITYKNVTLQVNFGPAPKTALPFTCRMLKDAAAADVVVSKPKAGKNEVLFPVGLPDQGLFEWLDGFIEKSPQYVELSDRKVLEWAKNSMVYKQRSNHNSNSSNDKPGMDFGIPMLDDMSVQKGLEGVVPALKRDFVHMELKANLLVAERAKALARFPSSSFKKVAVVAMGQPPAELIAKTHEKLLAEKVEKAKWEKEKADKEKEQSNKRKAYDEEWAKEKRRKEEKKEEPKEGEDAEKKEEDAADKEGEEKKAEEGEEKKEEEVEEEEKPVELTEEEKKVFFTKSETPDLAQWDLAKTFANFTLPAKEEGFDEIRYVWSPQDKCAAHMKAWMLDLKKTQRAEDLEPSKWFHDKFAEWEKFEADCKRKQNDTRDVVSKNKRDAAKKEEDKKQKAEKKEAAEAEEKKEEEKKEEAAEGEEGEKKEGEEGEKKEEEKKEEEEPSTLMKVALEEEKKEEEFDEEPDVDKVEDINDIGNGTPLFANFVYEDWVLLGLRFELHLLCHAFKRDLDDADRPGFTEAHLAYYYNKYFKKTFDLKSYNVKDLAALVELIKETQSVNAESGFLEAVVVDAETAFDKFVRMSEENRRERQRCIDAGDETASLKFQRRGDNRSGGGDRGNYRGSGGGGGSGGYGGRSDAGYNRAAPVGSSRGGAPDYGRGAPPRGGSGYGGDSRGGGGGGGSYGGGGGGSYGGGGGRAPAGGDSRGSYGPAPSRGGYSGGAAPPRGGDYRGAPAPAPYGRPSGGGGGGGASYGRPSGGAPPPRGGSSYGAPSGGGGYGGGGGRR